MIDDKTVGLRFFRIRYLLFQMPLSLPDGHCAGRSLKKQEIQGGPG
jgi:hypothetical protein